MQKEYKIVSSSQPPLTLFRFPRPITKPGKLCIKPVPPPPTEAPSDPTIAPGAKSAFKPKLKLTIDSNDPSTTNTPPQPPLLWQDDEHTYVGHSQADDNHYMCLILEGDTIKAIPVIEKYKFTQQLNYTTLTIEEAEDRLKKKTENDRWLMKEYRKDTANAVERGPTEALDYQEEWDDDEAMEELVDNEEGLETMKRQLGGEDLNKSLTKTGKEMAKLVKKDGAVTWSDEDSDPYGSELDDEEPQEQLKIKVEERLNEVVKKRRASEDESAMKKVKLGLENLITKEEIVDLLRKESLTTKELIAKVKRKLKADKRNKEILSNVVKTVAVGGKNGTLELKSELR